MNSLQLELTRLIGKKELLLGCLIRGRYFGDTELAILTFLKASSEYSRFYSTEGIEEDAMIYEIIGQPATLSDLHRWMMEQHDTTGGASKISFGHRREQIAVYCGGMEVIYIPYDSSKELLDQSEETLTQIIELIKSYQ